MISDRFRQSAFADREIQIGLFVLGFAIAAIVTQVTGFSRDGEAWEYSVIAESLRQGAGGSYPYLGADYRFYGPALYPRLVAWILDLSSGNQQAVIWLQAVLFAATGPVIYSIARIFLARPYALAAGLLAICHPGNLVYTAKLHPHALDVLLIATAFLLVCRLTMRPSWPGAVGAGLALGLAALSRATIGSFAIAWALWFLYRHRHQFGRGVVLVGLTTAAAILTVVPVVIGGFQQYGRLVPLRSDAGANFWIGNNPHATGTLVTFESESRVVQDLLPPELATRLSSLNEVEQNAALTNAALAWIASEPGQFARLFLRKLGYFWWFAPSTGTNYPPSWNWLYWGYYTVILATAALGLGSLFTVGASADRQVAAMFVLLLSSYSLTQAMFYVEGRHRWEIEALVLILAVVGAARVARLNPLQMSERLAAQ